MIPPASHESHYYDPRQVEASVLDDLRLQIVAVICNG